MSRLADRRIILGLLLIPALGMAAEHVASQSRTLSVAGRAQSLQGFQIGLAGGVQRIVAHNANSASDVIGLVLAGYINSTGPATSTALDVTVNQLTGESLETGYTDFPDQGVFHAPYVNVTDAAGTGELAFAFNGFDGGSSASCTGIAVDESDGSIYLACTDIEDGSGFKRALYAKYDSQGNFINAYNFAGTDPGNNEGGGVAVDELTYDVFFCGGSFGASDIGTHEWMSAVSFRQNFVDTNYAFFFPIQATVGGVAKGIAVSPGTDIAVIVGYFLEDTGAQAAGGGVLDVDGMTNDQFFSVTPAPGPDTYNKVAWDHNGVQFLTNGTVTADPGTGVDVFATAGKYIGNPFSNIWLFFYTGSAGGGGSGTAWDGINDAYFSGSQRNPDTGTFQALITHLNDDGSRQQNFLIGGSVADNANSIAYDTLTNQIFVVGNTRSPGWSTDGSSFVGPQDGFVGLLSL